MEWDRRRTTEDRGQRAEDRGQKTEDRDRGQTTDDRGQKTETECATKTSAFAKAMADRLRHEEKLTAENTEDAEFGQEGAEEKNIKNLKKSLQRRLFLCYNKEN